MDNHKNKNLNKHISHRTARSWSQAAADERLAHHHQTQLEAHLASCPRCRNFSANITNLERQLRTTLSENQARYAPGELPATIAAVKSSGVRRYRDPTPGRVVLKAIQFAALLFLIFALGWSIRSFSTGETSNPAVIVPPSDLGGLTAATATPTTPTTRPTATPLPPTATLITPTDTPPPPTATLSPAVPLDDINDLVGIWKGRWSDTSSIYIDFKANKTVRIFFAGGESFGDTSSFVLEGSRITFTAATGACENHPTATYEVLVVKRESVPVQLQFILVGEDFCSDRVDALAGKTLIYQNP